MGRLIVALTLLLASCGQEPPIQHTAPPREIPVSHGRLIVVGTAFGPEDPDGDAWQWYASGKTISPEGYRVVDARKRVAFKITFYSEAGTGRTLYSLNDGPVTLYYPTP